MKYATVCMLSKSIMVLACLSRNMLIPFFPLYIKYLNLSLMQMGIIRSLQILTALAFTTLSIKTGRKLSNNTLKRISISGSIFTTITVCICLLFLPPNKFARNVTHCVNNENLHLQDLYNLHFKKNSNSITQNITNEFVTEKNDGSISKDISKQYSDFEESKVLNSVKIHATEANEIKDSQHINSKEVIDEVEYKIKNAKTINENADIKEVTEGLKKSGRYRDSNIRKNFIPSTNYDYSNTVSVQDAKMNEVRIGHKQKGKANSSSKRKKINTSSVFNALAGISNEHTSISRYQNLNSVIADDIIFTPEEAKDSTMEVNNKNIYNPNIIKEEIPLPDINSKFNEVNSHDYSDLNNNNNENIISRTKILLGKHNNHHRVIKNHRNKNENVLHNKNTNYYSDWDVNIRQDEDRKSPKELDELFREQRSVSHSTFSRDVKEHSSYNNDSSEKITTPFHRVEVTNKNLFRIKDFVWSETFLFALVLAVLYELFSSQIVPWTETFCYYNADELNYDHLFASQIFLSKSFLWLISFPVVGVLTTITLCPYQIALHCFIAAVILIFAFLAALIFLSMDYTEIKHFRSRKLSKPPPMDRNIRESTLQRIFVCATNILIGAGTACYVENILWNIETLSAFPYNYEYLYCGYYSLNVLASLATSKYLQYRSNKQQSATNSDDSDSDNEYIHFSYEWIKKHKEIIYVEEQKSNIITVTGTFLLSVILFVVPFLSRAWMLLPLALLKGATDAFLEAIVPRGCWSTLMFGYSIGCFLGSTIANVFGMRGLFSSASCIMLVCSFSWLCYSIFLRCFKKPYMQISLDGHSHDSIPSEAIVQDEDEEEDWLEQAIKRDQFNQSGMLQQ